VVRLANLLKLYAHLEDLVEDLEHTLRTQDRLTLTSKGTAIAGISDSLEETVREIQEIARFQLHQLDAISSTITPKRETLQIISGLGIDIFDELVVLRQHFQRFQSQSQLKKGLAQILDTTSEIDYVIDSVKTLLRFTRRMLAQLNRLEILTKL
jgi:hypothetical protein